MSGAGLSSEPPIFLDWQLGFTHPQTRAASAYWDKIRAGRGMPTRGDLSDAGMAAFAANTTVVEVLGRAGSWNFRLRDAGEQTRRIFGDVAGKTLGEFLPPASEKRWRYGMEAVANRKVRLRNYGSVTAANKDGLDFETMIAPLGEGGKVSDLLTVITTWPRGAGR